MLQIKYWKLSTLFFTIFFLFFLITKTKAEPRKFFGKSFWIIGWNFLHWSQSINFHWPFELINSRKLKLVSARVIKDDGKTVKIETILRKFKVTTYFTNVKENIIENRKSFHVVLRERNCFIIPFIASRWTDNLHTTRTLLKDI